MWRRFRREETVLDQIKKVVFSQRMGVFGTWFVICILTPYLYHVIVKDIKQWADEGSTIVFGLAAMGFFFSVMISWDMKIK